MRSFVLLFLFALAGMCQGTIYWFNGPEDTKSVPSVLAKKLVTDQLEAVKMAYAAKDSNALHQLIDYSQFIALHVSDFHVITYVGDCFIKENHHIWGQVVANRSVGEVYDILLVESEISPTGYSIAYLLRANPKH